MSVSSILALLVGAIAVKTKSGQVARRSEDRIAELEGERDRQYEENVALIARIATLEDAIATANAQARRDQELIDLWRERALATPARQVVDFRPQQQAAALQQAQAHLQQMTKVAQNAMVHGQRMMMLGAQGLIDAELWCNCVPARHDMFLRGE